MEKEISTLYKMKYGIECVYDQLVIERDREKVKGRLLKTKRTFNLEGWVPEPAMEVVDKMLTEYQCCFAYRDPEEGDEVPVLTQNNSVVYPFESITEMYSLPDYKGVDPTKYFAFFYAMFFGIMLSDAGYGIVIALACFIVLRKFALEGMTYKMIKMFFYCGLSTILWGALFGGWFGDFFQVAAKSHIWQRDYHTGLVVQPDRRSDQAFDLVPGIRRDSHLPGHGHQSGHADQRRQMAGCGLRRLLLVFSHTGCSHVAGRKLHIRSSGKAGHVYGHRRSGNPSAHWRKEQKKAFGKVIGGFSSLYDITSYLSDILSYARLLALGLATGVIAQVVNLMGSLAGGGIAGALVLLFAFIIGHTFNLAINALGAFVHSSRLQYIEFFGKFYEDGGEEFDPFRKNTKYVRLTNDTDGGKNDYWKCYGTDRCGNWQL